MPPAYQGWLIPGDSRPLAPVPLADQSPHFFCGLSYSCHCSRPNHQGRDQGAGDTNSAEPSPSTLSSPVSAHRHGNTHKVPSPSPSLSASWAPSGPSSGGLWLIEHPSLALAPLPSLSPLKDGAFSAILVNKDVTAIRDCRPPCVSPEGTQEGKEYLPSSSHQTAATYYHWAQRKLRTWKTQEAAPDSWGHIKGMIPPSPDLHLPIHRKALSSLTWVICF